MGADQNLNEISPYTSQTWLVSKRQDVEKKEPLCPAGRNVYWHTHCEKQLGRFFKKLKTEIPFDSAIPLLSTKKN